MATRSYKSHRSISHEAKLSDLYKYCAEGWSVTMAENKAGLKVGTAEYDLYKESTHYTTVRRVYTKKPNHTHRGY